MAADVARAITCCHVAQACACVRGCVLMCARLCMSVISGLSIYYEFLLTHYLHFIYIHVRLHIFLSCVTTFLFILCKRRGTTGSVQSTRKDAI